MKTLTIELDDEAFEMLQASARQNECTAEALAAACVEPDVRNDQHVVWDVEFEPSGSHRRDFRRGDVAQCVETGALGLVVDATATRVRISVTRHVRDAFSAGQRVAGPDQHVVVTSAAPVEGLKVHEWSIFNRPEFGRFAPAS